MNTLKQLTMTAPARQSVRYEKVLFGGDLAEKNPYRGEPRPELDEAWHELLRYSNIRVSADDLRRINRTSVQLSDGSGSYGAQLDVYHQLHCLKYIRRSLHPAAYPPVESNDTIKVHIDHCLDTLRQHVMCHADIALVTFDWIDGYRKPFPNFNIEHECRSFDAVNSWAREHAYDIFDGKSLIHPQLGRLMSISTLKVKREDISLIPQRSFLSA